MGALSSKFPQVSFPKKCTVSIFLRTSFMNLCLLTAAYEGFGIWGGGFSSKNKIKNYSSKNLRSVYSDPQNTVIKC